MAKLEELSDIRSIDCKMLCAISGLNTLSSNCPWDPAIVIPVWFPITFTQTIVTASDCVGFTFPGIIDEPGSLAGKFNSP